MCHFMGCNVFVPLYFSILCLFERMASFRNDEDSILQENMGYPAPITKSSSSFFVPNWIVYSLVRTVYTPGKSRPVESHDSFHLPVFCRVPRSFSGVSAANHSIKGG